MVCIADVLSNGRVAETSERAVFPFNRELALSGSLPKFKILICPEVYEEYELGCWQCSLARTVRLPMSNTQEGSGSH